ncbi:MAG: FAD-binding protein [Myxococcota bacterium]
MNAQKVDAVVVVGGGAAGALAAVAARRAGAQVIMVRRGGGATTQSSGAVDVAEDHEGKPLGPARSAFSSGAPYLDAARRLAARNPFHPYARTDGCVDAIPDALKLLTEVAAAVELQGSTQPGRNLVLASVMGTVKRSALAQSCMVAGDLAQETVKPGEKIGVVHMAGLPLADGRHVVATLRYLGMLGAGGEGGAPNLHALEVSHFRRRRDALRAPRELALALESEGGGVALGQALKAALKDSGGVDRVLLPPLLGLTHMPDVFRLVQEAAGVPVAELLSLPPSVPGERLQRALDEGVKHAGVEVMEGEATRALVDGKRVVGLEVKLASGGAPQEVRTRSVVLCTGKYLSGGIRREHRFFEPLLDLPVFIDGRHVTEGFVGDETSSRPEEQQPFLRAGVLTDPQLRPLDAHLREPVFGNVYAAGSVLGGYDPTRERSGLGVAAVTGMLAGRWAAR